MLRVVLVDDKLWHRRVCFTSWVLQVLWFRLQMCMSTHLFLCEFAPTLTKNPKISQKRFLHLAEGEKLVYRQKQKVHWKQTWWINHDVHKACDLNIRWSFCSTEETKNSSRQKHQICVQQWEDYNAIQMNTWNKQKIHISIMISSTLFSTVNGLTGVNFFFYLRYLIVSSS